MRRLRRVLLVAPSAFALLAAPAATVPATAVPAAHATPVDRTGLQRELDLIVAGGATGALAEVRDEHGVWRGSSGVAVAGRARPVPAHGRFRAGSITKTFVATVVLQLAAEGRLRLDDTVERWLPGAVPGGDRISVRQLLNHTSGLYDYARTLLADPADILAIRWRSWDPWELARLGTSQPALFEPGKGWSYSSTNYILLGLIVRRVTGHSYDDEIKKRIIQPLRLRGTSLPGTFPFIRGPHPRGYLPIRDGEQTRLEDITVLNPSAAWAAGEMISTAGNLNRFYAALLGGKLLRAAELRQMIPPQEGADYGLGLRSRPDLGCAVPVYGHDGDAPGYSTWSFHTADGRRQVTVSVTWGTTRPRAAAMKPFLAGALCPTEPATGAASD